MKFRVYVLEDNAEFRGLVAKVAQKDGWEAVECADGAALLADLAAQGDRALVLMDINLPGKDGFEILQDLAQAGLRPVVYFMTGGARVNAAAASLIAEASGVQVAGTLLKPVSIEEIRAALAEGAKGIAGG